VSPAPLRSIWDAGKRLPVCKNLERVLPSWFKHAFAVDPPGPATPDELERDLIDRLCREIVRRRLTTPALVFLETSHPLNYIGSQFMLFFAPVVELIVAREKYRTLVGFLERRGSIEYICQRIEHFEAQRHSAGKTENA
jgi:hypothetical protein